MCIRDRLNIGVDVVNGTGVDTFSFCTAAGDVYKRQPFTGPTSALQDARVKTHFQASVYPLSLRILVAVITISH